MRRSEKLDRRLKRKLVLINPPTSFDQIYGAWDLSALDTYCPPLGLLYLAGYVREDGHEIHVVDVPALKWSLQDTVDFVLSLKPDIVGLTAMTTHILNANAIADGLKRNGLASPIVIGGPHFTATPVETLQRSPSIDYGVVGEGEITFLELIQKISNNIDVKDLQGLAWRQDDGSIIVNSPRSMIKNLDILPLPAWDLLPNFPHAYPHNALETKRLPAASIITSRGCPHKCTFCDRAVFGSVVRSHSSEYTLDMIRHLKDNYGIKDLMILDDNFLLDKTKLFHICDKIIEENMDLKWYCLSHVKFMTEDRLRKIKEAGCWIMEVGIESGCERILRLLRRTTPKSLIADAIKRAKKNGIKIKGNFIFGLPTETKESLEETIQFATSIDIALFQQTFLTIWPGCELSENADEYGHTEREWDKLGHFQISFIPNGLTPEDLLRASKEAFRRFYLRPRIVLEILSSIRTPRAFKSALIAFIAFLKSIFR
ncbi:MAG: B12-binding domain-containing radical SAM protein [Candidatus Hodarchaeota archaeon]